jgi:peptide/nickel transport system permease protein
MGTQLDVFYTLVWGTRSALRFGLLVTLLTGLIGVTIGALSAYLGGWPGMVAMRIVDAFLAFPLIAGVVILQQLATVQESSFVLTRMSVGSAPPEPTFFQTLLQQADPVMLAFILFLWMPYARLTHTMVLQMKGTEFMEAARALGASSGRIVLHHLIPNSISPAIVLAARDIGLVVILQASLTFIGIAESSEWGALLSIGRRWIIGTGGNPFTYWWVFAPGTLALIFFGVGWNLLGDGLNDWLNPRAE